MKALFHLVVYSYLMVNSGHLCIGLLFDVGYVLVADGIMQRLGSKMSDETRFRSRLEKVRNCLMIIVLGGMAVKLLAG